jgi:hypothetical protein
MIRITTSWTCTGLGGIPPTNNGEKWFVAAFPFITGLNGWIDGTDIYRVEKFTPDQAPFVIPETWMEKF